MDNIVVTGAGGFIGGYLAKELLNMGFGVIGVSRAKHNRLESKEKYIHVMMDIKDRSSYKQLYQYANNIKAIVNLAADINIPGDDETIDVNCKSSYYLAKFSRECETGKFINMSSVPVIGRPLYSPIDENHPVNPCTVYHTTKYASEKIIENICIEKTKVMNFRISSPIGVGMNSNNFLSVLLKKCHKNEDIILYGQGKRIQSYIDVRDVCRAIVAGIRSDSAGLYIISGPAGISNYELAVMCRNITCSKSNIILSDNYDSQANIDWSLNGDKALKDLGYKYKYDLNECVEWIINKGERQ